jgi:outer membrane protein assembly factor BamD (BamD/ComL family)
MVKGLLCFLFVLCLADGRALAQEKGNRYILDEKLQMDLGDHFFQEGDYYRAITEYKKFLFFFPESMRAEEALWKIASSYFSGKRWDDALSSADDLLKKYPLSPWVPEALLLKGRCWVEKKEYSQARYYLRRAQEVSPGSNAAHEAQWQTAHTYVKEERWKEAAVEFRKMERTSKLYPRAETWAQGLDSIDTMPQKSPTTAGILAAILPGSGHLYTERYRDAAIALALNAAFIWGMIEAFERENYAAGAILTFFELGWYSGNIYSAVSSAHKYNQRKRKEYIDSLEKAGQFSLGISFQEKRPALALRYVF